MLLSAQPKITQCRRSLGEFPSYYHLGQRYDVVFTTVRAFLFWFLLQPVLKELVSSYLLKWSRLCLAEFSKQKERNVSSRVVTARCIFRNSHKGFGPLARRSVALWSLVLDTTGNWAIWKRLHSSNPPGVHGHLKQKRETERRIADEGVGCGMWG